MVHDNLCLTDPCTNLANGKQLKITLLQRLTCKECLHYCIQMQMQWILALPWTANENKYFKMHVNCTITSELTQLTPLNGAFFEVSPDQQSLGSGRPMVCFFSEQVLLDRIPSMMTFLPCCFQRRLWPRLSQSQQNVQNDRCWRLYSSWHSSEAAWKMKELLKLLKFISHFWASPVQYGKRSGEKFRTECMMSVSLQWKGGQGVIDLRFNY